MLIVVYVMSLQFEYYRQKFQYQTGSIYYVTVITFNRYKPL